MNYSLDKSLVQKHCYVDSCANHDSWSPAVIARTDQPGSRGRTLGRDQRGLPGLSAWNTPRCCDRMSERCNISSNVTVGIGNDSEVVRRLVFGNMGIFLKEIIKL